MHFFYLNELRIKTRPTNNYYQRLNWVNQPSLNNLLYTGFNFYFLILNLKFRYKKIIKENHEEAEESNADIVSLIAFDNHL